MIASLFSTWNRVWVRWANRQHRHKKRAGLGCPCGDEDCR